MLPSKKIKKKALNAILNYKAIPEYTEKKIKKFEDTEKQATNFFFFMIFGEIINQVIEFKNNLMCESNGLK